MAVDTTELDCGERRQKGQYETKCAHTNTRTFIGHFTYTVWVLANKYLPIEIAERAQPRAQKPIMGYTWRKRQNGSEKCRSLILEILAFIYGKLSQKLKESAYSLSVEPGMAGSVDS